MAAGLIEKLLFWRGPWWLEGWDTFGAHAYPLPGRYPSRESATRAARRYLRNLERTQPTEFSGGQDRIQDRVYVRGPDGKSFRVLPE